MGLMDWLKELLGKRNISLPEQLNSPEELIAKGKEMIGEQTEKLEQLKDKIPGEVDDKIIDAVSENVENQK